MIEAMLLAAALGWVASAVGAGMLVYRWQRRRWVQVATTLFLIWLPFWDVIPGYYLYKKAVREVGGVRIYRTVKAEGYLDLAATDCGTCWSQLRDSPYHYIEIERTGATGVLSTIESGKGFYEYRLSPVDDAGCTSFNQLKFANQLRKGNGIQGSCVVSVKRSQPLSRYEYSFGNSAYPASGQFQPVRLSWNRVRDRQSKEILAEAYRVHFVSWLGHQIEIPAWAFTSDAADKPLFFLREDVVIPAI